MGVTVEGNQIPRLHAWLERQMKAVDRVEKQQGANALVKIFAAPSERFQFGGFGQQLRERRRAAERVQRLVAHGGVWRGDDACELAGHGSSRTAFQAVK